MIWVVVSGNPFDGLAIHGPFDEAEDAACWAEDQRHGEWQVVGVHPTGGES